MSPSSLQNLISFVETSGVAIELEAMPFPKFNTYYSFPYIILTLCLNGTARALYDMQEMTQSRNDLALIMPGHLLQPLECSEDYRYARLAISQKMFEELKQNLFTHDYDKFHYAPVCTLSDEQVQRLMTILEQLALIASHSELELRHRNHILLAQLVVGYEYLNYYRRKQDEEWRANRLNAIFSQFCDLVITHFRESREVNYYAQLMHIHPKYLSRVITAAHGITPLKWIEQYVVNQAKRLIANQPNKTLKQIAFQLGFDEPTSFYRYFKRGAGITAKDYKDSLRHNPN